MRVRALKTALVFVVAVAALGVASARAADCGDSADGFNQWLASFKQVAVQNGVSQQAVDSALNGVMFDSSVAAHDRGQNFGQNFAAFSARHVTPARIKKGKTMILAYAEPLERIEQRYGVPGPVFVAIWGLETDFGSGLGGYRLSARWRRSPTIVAGRKSIAPSSSTRSCSSSAALMRPSQRGAWAGEIGQTQFMPSAYLKYAVNAQGGGARRSDFQSRRRAGVDREFPSLEGLEPGRGLGRRPAKFQRLTAMELVPGLRQDGRSVRGQAGGERIGRRRQLSSYRA